MITLLIATWLLYLKAGEHGWATIVPIYNVFVLFKILFGSGWKFLLMLIPIYNIILAFRIYFRMAKVYGKGAGFGFGLLFLGWLFLPILGYGDSQYCPVT